MDEDEEKKKNHLKGIQNNDKRKIVHVLDDNLGKRKKKETITYVARFIRVNMRTHFTI